MQSVYSAALADWATENLLEKSYSLVEAQSVYSEAPAAWATSSETIVSMNLQ